VLWLPSDCREKQRRFSVWHAEEKFGYDIKMVKLPPDEVPIFFSNYIHKYLPFISKVEFQQIVKYLFSMKLALLWVSFKKAQKFTSNSTSTIYIKQLFTGKLTN
jgi:hypothetical protein